MNMVKMDEPHHSHAPLPSFLFRILKDLEIDPLQIDLVADNAAARPNPYMRIVFSAPSLLRSPHIFMPHPVSADNFRGHTPSALNTKARISQFPLIVASATTKANARWSPSGMMKHEHHRFAVNSGAVKDMLLQSSFPTENKKNKKKNNKKSIVKSPRRHQEHEDSTRCDCSTRHPIPLSRSNSVSKSHSFGYPVNFSIRKPISTDSLLEMIKPSRRASPERSKKSHHHMGSKTFSTTDLDSMVRRKGDLLAIVPETRDKITSKQQQDTKKNFDWKFNDTDVLEGKEECQTGQNNSNLGYSVPRDPARRII